MPPWGADPAHGVFKNDPRLSDARHRDDREVGRRRRAEGRRQGSAGGAAVRRRLDDRQARRRVRDGGGVHDSRRRRDPVSSTSACRPTSPKTSGSRRSRSSRGARAQVHHVIAFTQPAGAPLKPGGELGPTNIGGVTPNKPGAGVRAGRRRGCCAATPTSCCRCTTRPTATETTDRTQVGIIYAKQPPTKMAARRHGDQPALRDSGRRRQRRSARRRSTLSRDTISRR